MKKKVIIYNGQLFMGGIERVLTNYLQELSKDENLDITLLIRINDPEKNIFAKDVPSNIKVEYLTKEKEILYKNKASQNRKRNLFYRIIYQWILLKDRFKMKKRIDKFFIENPSDVIIDFDLSLGKYIGETKAKKVGRCSYSLANSNKSSKKIAETGERLGKYDQIITLSDDMLKELKNLYPNLADKAVRIYNPVSLEKIERLGRDKEDLNENELELLKKPYIVSVSRLVPGKGQKDLIEIYSQLKKDGIREKLYIIGEGKTKKDLEKQIKELGLEEDVYLLGQKKNPYIWVKNAKLFVHASYGEGLPNVLIESVACSTPVVAYDCPTGPKEVLMDGKYGEVIPLGNKKMFKEKVSNLLKDEIRYEKLKESLKERAKDFSTNVIIKEFKKKLCLK